MGKTSARTAANASLENFIFTILMASPFPPAHRPGRETGTRCESQAACGYVNLYHILGPVLYKPGESLTAKNPGHTNCANQWCR